MWFEDLAASALNKLVKRRPPRPEPGLLLGYATEPPHQTVVLPDRQRCEHCVCVGKTGTGKTYFLERLTLDLAGRGEGFAFFDFHGDASLSLLGRLVELAGSPERLVIIDPSHTTRSPGINVLECEPSDADRFRKVAELSSILRQRWGVDSFGARTEELLRNSLYVLASTDRTLADLPRLLTDSRLRNSLTRVLEHPDIREYWEQRYEPLSEAMKAAFREPLLNRASAFLTEPSARHLLGQRQSTVTLESVMEHRQWLILRLPKGRLREHAHTLGNLLFAQLQFAAFARERVPPHRRHPFTIICDEVQNLAENDLASLITEGRKFGIAVITANQFWEQLPRELRGCLLSAASHVCFRVSSADAQVLASELTSERRSRLAATLTHLDRGEAVVRTGRHPVVRFKVPALPASTAIQPSVLDQFLTPVTRLRSEIEVELRNGSDAPPPEPTPVRRGTPLSHPGEGQHDW